MKTNKPINLEEYITVWDKIEKQVNWNRIHTTMNVLEWKWVGCEGVPTIEDLKKAVIDKLRYLMAIDDLKDGVHATSSGGFRVSRVIRKGKKDGYMVEFIVTSADVNCGFDEFCGISS
jgi:hypothetical protein